MVDNELQMMLDDGCTITNSPAIRASHINAISDPFGYFLTVRLGLSNAFAVSEALSRGSWLHKRMELWDAPPKVVGQAASDLLSAREAEIKTTAKELGLTPDDTLHILERARVDQMTAFGWFDAAATLKIPGTNLASGLYEALSPKRYVRLGEEVLAVCPNPISYIDDDDEAINPNLNIACRFDSILYDKRDNTIWIMDAKTCAVAPVKRAETIPVEFATWHYMFIAGALVKYGVFKEAYPQLPDDVKFGGMIHLLIQKPTIKICGKDRPYVYRIIGKKSGKGGKVSLRKNGKWMIDWIIKGETDENGRMSILDKTMTEEEAVNWLHSWAGVKPKKEYKEEFSNDMFLDRCRRWYKGEKEFSHRALKLLGTEVPISLSRTSADSLGFREFEEYFQIINILSNLSNAAPHIHNFPRVVRHRSIQNPYTDFYLTPPAAWPEVRRRNRLIYKHRDPEVDIPVSRPMLLDTPAQGSET